MLWDQAILISVEEILAVISFSWVDHCEGCSLLSEEGLMLEHHTIAVQSVGAKVVAVTDLILDMLCSATADRRSLIEIVL